MGLYVAAATRRTLSPGETASAIKHDRFRDLKCSQVFDHWDSVWERPERASSCRRGIFLLFFYLFYFKQRLFMMVLPRSQKSFLFVYW